MRRFVFELAFARGRSAWLLLTITSVVEGRPINKLQNGIIQLIFKI